MGDIVVGGVPPIACPSALRLPGLDLDCTSFASADPGARGFNRQTETRMAPCAGAHSAKPHGLSVLYQVEYSTTRASKLGVRDPLERTFHALAARSPPLGRVLCQSVWERRWSRDDGVPTRWARPSRVLVSHDHGRSSGWRRDEGAAGLCHVCLGRCAISGRAGPGQSERIEEWRREQIEERPGRRTAGLVLYRKHSRMDDDMRGGGANRWACVAQVTKSGNHSRRRLQHS